MAALIKQQQTVYNLVLSESEAISLASLLNHHILSKSDDRDCNNLMDILKVLKTNHLPTSELRLVRVQNENTSRTNLLQFT